MRDYFINQVSGTALRKTGKRDKAEPGKEIHNVIEGETMYQISQKYGVKLRKLYEYNLMTDGKEPVAGQKIWLRSVRPVN